MEPATALRDTFGLADFRPGQRAVVDAVLDGRPTVAVMPTGAGKSLCYQLPAVVAGGTALVVSPLIALMKDQVDALTARGVPCAAITSGMGPGEQAQKLAELGEGRLRLVYVAPERLKNSRFEEALARIAPGLSLLAIDEAHCISEWGHDFRPDYMRLGDFVARHRPPRLVALTATATPEVRRDIVRQLGMQDPAVFVRGFDRPNLRFGVKVVRNKDDKEDQVVSLVRGRAGGTAIVYASTRKHVEALAARLKKSGIRAGGYHGGLDDDVRTEVQDRFMCGKYDVIVATNAFGMGVDKSDVRLVLHADLPRSPEAYYQEAGRGGRDGDPADCVLLFQNVDVKLQEFLIEANSPSVEVLRSLWKLIRDDPRRGGAEPKGLRQALPGKPSEAAVGSALRFLLRAGWLRERDGFREAMRPGEDPTAPPPLPIDATALQARNDMEKQKLERMIDYVRSIGCRRRYLLDYFGDEDARSFTNCGACDTCSGTGRRELDRDESSHVRAALSLIERLRGRFGRTRVAAVLAGNDEDERRHNVELECPERGALRAGGQRYALDLLRALEAAKLIVASPGEYPTLSITLEGRRAADGSQSVTLAMPELGKVPRRKRGATGKSGKSAAPSAAASSSSSYEPLDPEIVARLKQFRQTLAAQESSPAYVIFSNKTLEELARRRPADSVALAMVHGMGPIRTEKYGKALLALFRSAQQ